MVLMPIGNEHYSFVSFIAKEINNVALSLILTPVELQKDQWLIHYLHSSDV